MNQQMELADAAHAVYVPTMLLRRLCTAAREALMSASSWRVAAAGGGA